MFSWIRTGGIGWCGRVCAGLLAVCVLPASCAPQAASPQTAPFSVNSLALPKAFLRQQYRAELGVQGGVAPFKWVLESGVLPPGVELAPNGVVSGVPTVVGDFPVEVVVTDSSVPPRQRNDSLILRVVAPLMARWLRPPKVTGTRVEGAIQVSNQTGVDFDLTAIVLAVNEIGRATAIAYQHFTLQHDTTDFEIPFGEQLPPGAYDVHVDVVAEVAEISAIHRVRLVSGQKLQVVQGP